MMLKIPSPAKTLKEYHYYILHMPNVHLFTDACHELGDKVVYRSFGAIRIPLFFG